MIHSYAAFGPNQELRPYEYPEKKLKETELLIKVTHCGLCRTDLYMIENSWNRSTYPIVPGHEIVGTIVKKGSKVKQQIGSRVGVGWIHSTCQSCPECKNGEPNICQKKAAIYSNGKYGGFGEYVVSDSSFTFPIPQGLESKYAAPLLCAGATVYTPLMKYRVWEQEAIGVLGLGGLGHLAVQFARAMGANVSAISHSSDKREEALFFGASNFFTYNNLPKNQCFNFLLCTVDAPLDWDRLLSLLKPNGILCFVSRPPEGISFHPKNLVSTQRVICGSNNATPQEIANMLLLARDKKIYPMVEEMPMKEINKAIERLKQNKVRYRIVLTNSAA